MSSWLEVIGWIVIALGVCLTWRAGRLLLSLTPARGNTTRRTRYAHYQAWRDVRFSLLWVVMGIGWATSLYEHWQYLWLWGAYLVVVAGWEIGAWQRSRRRKSGGQPAATP